MSKLAFWNTADLLPPPENACRVKISLNDATRIHNVFQNAFKAFKVLDMLDLEAALLSRVIWKSKSRFRGDKMLHKLEAVNRGLLKYLALNIPNVYKSFSTKLPKIHESKMNSEIVVPSRQMLEWVLVRTQGFARLLCYLAHNCQEAVKGWIDPVKRGHIWSLTPIVIGILSRIWSIVKYLIVNACCWYTELLPFRLVLKSAGLRWLPSDYTLPEDIKLWLNMPHITDVVEKKGASELGLSLMQFLEMSDDEDSKEVEKKSRKQKSLMDFLDASDEEESTTDNQSKSMQNNLIGMLDNAERSLQSSIKTANVQVSNKSTSNSCTIPDINASADIGEHVPRGINTNSAIADNKSIKKKLKNKETHGKQFAKLEHNSQRNELSTSKTEKKNKFQHGLNKEGTPGSSSATKRKNENVTQTTMKKKKMNQEIATLKPKKKNKTKKD